MIFIQKFIETTINLPFWKELLYFWSNFSAIFVLKMHCIIEICCVSFISLTILQLSCILSTLTWCHNLTISNCHWQYCRILENMHQQPLCASFISLINKQMRILEAGNIFSMQRLVAEILRVIECRRNISERLGTRWLNILLALHCKLNRRQQRFYLLNWNPRGKLNLIVFCILVAKFHFKLLTLFFRLTLKIQKNGQADLWLMTQTPG